MESRGMSRGNFGTGTACAVKIRKKIPASKSFGNGPWLRGFLEAVSKPSDESPWSFIYRVKNNHNRVLKWALVMPDHMLDDMAKNGTPGILDFGIPQRIKFTGRFEHGNQPQIVKPGLDVEVMTVVCLGAFLELP